MNTQQFFLKERTTVITKNYVFRENEATPRTSTKQSHENDRLGHRKKRITRRQRARPSVFTLRKVGSRTVDRLESSTALSY